MRDPRLKKLANLLLNHSLNLSEGKKVLITGSNQSKPLMKELIKKAYEIGVTPYIELMDDELFALQIASAKEEQLKLQNKWNMERYQDLDAFIQIRTEENDAEWSHIATEKWMMAGKALKPANDFLVSNRKWVLLNYPTMGYAQKAKMSYDAFYDFLIDVCTVDYNKMEEAQKPLKALMEQTDKVRVTGKGTDISFSIKGIPAKMCFGERNIPDGEVYTAPVKNSVNGTITFNTPCPYQGTTFHDVSLTFENGKIVKAEADKEVKLNEILDTDKGARYVGEFAIGLNPKITEPMGDILFDEKIGGSIHFTPGQAYENADNGNRSSIHWDMVLIQTPEYGGGNIYFDDQLIRKDGLFVIEDLKGLNPSQLLER